ncbi:MAG: NAD(P)H-binding protein [Bryobacteraceae bacterium]|nr:NAD(P)H-binding protein [Bryobacteraceae bacterium]
MLLITTPTGNSGRHVVNQAIRAGKTVRAFVRDASKLHPDVASHVEVYEGDLQDERALQMAAEGTEAVFYCIPQSGEPEDVRRYYQSFAEPAARALQAACVKRVVTISGGKGDPDDIGPSGPLAAMEREFNNTGVATRHVRCGYFMENFLYTVPQLRFRNSFSLPVSADYPMALMAAEDIGKTAARWLLDSSWDGQEGVNVPFGQSTSCALIAEVFSEVLGKPITFLPITGDEYKQMLMKFGVSEAMGQSLKEMFASIHDGSIGDATGAAHQGGVTLRAWAMDHLKPAVESPDSFHG